MPDETIRVLELVAENTAKNLLSHIHSPLMSIVLLLLTSMEFQFFLQLLTLHWSKYERKIFLLKDSTYKNKTYKSHKSDAL